MTIGGFLELCNKHPDLAVNFEPHNQGSWRGVYSEAAIFVEPGLSHLADFVENINKLLAESWSGYKGGWYQYDLDTPLNFEYGESNWSDGDTLKELLESNPLLAAIWP